MTYTCAACGKTFESDWTDQEALFEREQHGWSDVDCAVVCDDCYMSEKHDAMWGAEAGAYIAQQQAEIARLQRERDGIELELIQMAEQCERLRAGLEEISHGGCYMDGEIARKALASEVASQSRQLTQDRKTPQSTA